MTSRGVPSATKWPSRSHQEPIAVVRGVVDIVQHHRHRSTVAGELASHREGAVLLLEVQAKGGRVQKDVAVALGRAPPHLR